MRCEDNGMTSTDGKLGWMAIVIVVTVMTITPAGENS
jgi:hypothetical protein